MIATPRTLRAPVLALLGGCLWLAGGGQAHACGACYGLADGPMIDAARLGIWFMLGTTVLVQGAFAAFFVYLHRRASRTTHPAPMPQAAGGKGDR